MARGSAVAALDWTLPPGFDPRTEPIYAAIDPEGSLAEIHEDNNLAYAFMAGGSFPPDGGAPPPATASVVRVPIVLR